MSTPEAHYRANRNYEKKNVLQFNLKLNRNTDSDIIGWLQRQQNKADAVQRLIRAEIEREESTT